MTWLGRLREKFKSKPMIQLVVDAEMAELEANCTVMTGGSGRKYTREMAEKLARESFEENEQTVARVEENIACWREGLLTHIELGNLLICFGQKLARLDHRGQPITTERLAGAADGGQDEDGQDEEGKSDCQVDRVR